MEKLEELKKKFILDSNAQIDQIEDLVERLSKYCKVDQNGNLFIVNRTIIPKLTIKDKILIALTARYIASKLHENISPDVSSDELSKFFPDKKMVLIARAKELKDEGKIIMKERGKYFIQPFVIDDFIKSIETR